MVEARPSLSTIAHVSARAPLLALGVFIGTMSALPAGPPQLSCLPNVEIGGISYLSIWSTASHAGTVPPFALGPVHAKAPRQARGCVFAGCAVDDDTPLYSVDGYAPSFRLAATMQGRGLTLFQVYRNEHARSGADFFDVAGKVDAIEVSEPAPDFTTRAHTAVVTDRPTIDRVVDMIRAAPLASPFVMASEREYYVSFQLRDGTSATFNYSRTRKLVHTPGPLAPSVELDAILTAVMTAGR